MKKAKLKEYIGKNVEITFIDGDIRKGILGFNDIPFVDKYGYRKADYFTIGNLNFKVSHIKKVVKI